MSKQTYTQIDQETAKEMMTRDDGHIIVDVRRQDEYDAGHIPGAILIPNESISNEMPQELPDLDQIILIYCRSGNRSKQAAEKLANMGYTNLYEFGGINTWTGEIVIDEDLDATPDAEHPSLASSSQQNKEITADETADDIPAEQQERKIRVSDGEHTVIYKLNDSDPAVALYEMLPIDAKVENYGSNEKIFYPESPIEASEGIEGGGEAGGLALFSPWGNVVMYYDSFGSYPGLYLLGEAIEGVDQVMDLTGTIHVEPAD